MRVGKPNFSLMGFLAMGFAVVGLAGIMAIYSVPVPLERAMAREAVLDEALAAAAAPDAPARLEALRTRLADSAGAVLPVSADMPARIAAERVAMRARLQAEARELQVKLRWLIVVLTIMASGFGIVLLQASRRTA